MKNFNSKLVFKEYSVNQQYLIPPSFEELIPENHLVRVINNVIDKMDLTPLLKKYKGGGASSYHPQMMLKVIVYAYTQRIYSSRDIAKALRENINFMWISGNCKPDFRTINRFRSSRLKGIIEDVFSSLVEMLIEKGLVKLQNYFLDGTKIEANANKYSWVWGKSTKRYKGKLQEQIKELLEQINLYNEKEDGEYGIHDLEELGINKPITAEELEEKVKEIDHLLDKDPIDKELKKCRKKIVKDFIPRTKKYEEQEQFLGDRNSYSKTDTDATFMRMKEDPMRTGQPKAGYNIQIGTENQFIVGYSIHQKPGDTTTMIPHLEKLKAQLGRMPENIVADAGYGSEENYQYLENNSLGKYVKFSYFHLEQKQSFKDNPYKVDNLKYNSYADEYTCPSGRNLLFKEEQTRESENGYEGRERIYECVSCIGCSLKDDCHKSKGNRHIKIRPKLNEFKEEVRTLLKSDNGVELRSKRCIEPESVFGQIKQNGRFRRFMLRGLENVNIEWSLLSIAHNLRKMASS